MRKNDRGKRRSKCEYIRDEVKFSIRVQDFVVGDCELCGFFCVFSFVVVVVVGKLDEMGNREDEKKREYK